MAKAKRVCTQAGCPVLVETGRCTEHARLQDQARGRRQARGYDRAYEVARADALRGATHCATCGEPFTVTNPATGGHVKAIRNGGIVSDGIKPECRSCNYGWSRTGS